ncbi:DUF72 domain-containing protein, partial [Enterococcus faecalis]|uniref:DUF72 domain-containing protein n=1 Tax=Enterococcus faecalis TaxID=1351 RepID=UPI003D6BC9C5
MALIIDSHKLFAFLVQFPGTFGCPKENVAYLQKIRHWFKVLPIAIEFRNNSWYQPNFLKQMLQFMIQNQFSLVIVD